MIENAIFEKSRWVIFSLIGLKSGKTSDKALNKIHYVSEIQKFKILFMNLEKFWIEEYLFRQKLLKAGLKASFLPLFLYFTKQKITDYECK